MPGPFSFNFWGKSSSDDITDSILSDSVSKGKPIYEFDPSGLEKAAKAARELRDDPNSAKILERSVLDAQNRRLEFLTQQKAYELRIEQAKIEAVKQQHDHAVEVLTEEARTHRTKAEYEDFLARKRHEDRMANEKASHLEQLKMQEDFLRRQEEARRKTLEFEFSKRADQEKEFSNQFWKNKSEYKKSIKDISLQKYALKMQNELDRSKLLFNSVQSMLKGCFDTFYEHPGKFITFVSGVCLLTAGFVASKRGVRILLNRVESKISTPKLVRESSPRFSFGSKSSLHGNLESQGLIFEPKTDSVLSKIVSSTSLLFNNKGLFKNYLFYGPPGTGKTLFAKKLALGSNLKYAIMNGGDVLPLRDKAIPELNKVTNWTNNFDGMILFMDEADAFLKKRDFATMGEEMRCALNSFLFLTGEASRRLMLVLATNKPEHLDRAVLDRIDSMVEFPLPDAPTRKRLFQHYFNKHITNDLIPNNFSLDDIINELVKISEGFSAREIAKILALENRNKEINKKLILDTVMSMHHQNILKRNWDIDSYKLSTTKKQ